jgi:hypothetical protein
MSFVFFSLICVNVASAVVSPFRLLVLSHLDKKIGKNGSLCACACFVLFPAYWMHFLWHLKTSMSKLLSLRHTHTHRQTYSLTCSLTYKEMIFFRGVPPPTSLFLSLVWILDISLKKKQKNKNPAAAANSETCCSLMAAWE